MASGAKNYVDNGGAIVKNPDGSFTAVSDTDFIGYRLKNLSNPRDGRDAVNKAYVDKKVSLPVDKKVSLPSLIGPPGSLTCSVYSTVTWDLCLTSHPKDY